MPDATAITGTAEKRARALWTYGTHVLHELLQSEAYARAVLGARCPVLGDEEIEAALAVRLGRQALLARQPVCALNFIVEEWVLRRVVGGQALMRERLAHLVTLSELRHVTVQVMPMSYDAHAGVDGPLTVPVPCGADTARSAPQKADTPRMEDFEVDESLVRSLLREQHPDLAGMHIHQTVRGWDNQLWRLGDELAVRFPRTPRAPELLRKEKTWLPVLAPRLPLPVPTPLRIGEPSARFPWPWTVTTWVPGEPADRAPVSHGAHAADVLAEFLRALHTNVPTEAPVNPTRGVPLERSRTVSRRRSRPSLPAFPVRSVISGMSGTRLWRLPNGRARRCGCTATFIPRMSSSRKGRSPA